MMGTDAMILVTQQFKQDEKAEEPEIKLPTNGFREAQ